MKAWIVVAAALVIPATPAFAQYDGIWLGQGAVAQSTMNNARANTRRAAGQRAEPPQPQPQQQRLHAAEDPDCRSSLTAEKRQSIYRGRTMLQGKAKADAWLKAECAG